MNIFTTLIAAAFLTACAAGPVQSDDGNTVLLGKRHVNDLTERDVIEVGARKGVFTGLRIRASGAPIEFKRVVVHFENGGEQVFERNRGLRRGKTSRIIESTSRANPA
ncbi:hypothetical protein [Elongatibacter sediminis]|uniref:Lipoprotein n=1 Tax=Elongatibacter sediminis TaxID=3119006 RepID=A0AAW9R9V1_9GAMM